MTTRSLGRSLGTIIYPDGSQAEVFEHIVGAPFWDSWIEIITWKTKRRLKQVF